MCGVCRRPSFSRELFLSHRLTGALSLSLTHSAYVVCAQQRCAFFGKRGIIIIIVNVVIAGALMNKKTVCASHAQIQFELQRAASGEFARSTQHNSHDKEERRRRRRCVVCARRTACNAFFGRRSNARSRRSHPRCVRFVSL